MIKSRMLYKLETIINIWTNESPPRLHGQLHRGEHIVILSVKPSLLSKYAIILCAEGVFQTSDWACVHNFERRFERISL